MTATQNPDPSDVNPTVADVLQRLERGTADLLWLAAVCKQYPATAAQALQQLDENWKRAELKYSDAWVADQRRAGTFHGAAFKREGNGE